MAMGMNDRLSFLKFFFESGKYSDCPTLTEKIADFFPALIFVYDLQNQRLRYINRRFTEYFGLALEETRGSEDLVKRLVYREDVDPFKKTLSRFVSLNEDGTYSFRCRFNHKHGSYRYFETQGTILNRSPDGKASALLFVSQDTADHVKEQEEMSIVKQLFSETEELLQVGSWCWDIYHNRIVWTSGFCKMLGYTQAELEEKMDLDFFLQHVQEGYRETLQAIFNKALDTKTDFTCEYTINTKTGDPKIVSTNGKVVVDEKENVRKVLAITRDITVLKDAEREQERSLRELNRSNKELEEFAYIASHDLQEPLRKISMFSERLKTKYGPLLDVEATMFINRISASAENMRTLIHNLLEFSRTNRSLSNYRLVNLKTVWDQVIADQELKIEETKTTVNICSPLPLVEGITAELIQLFNNLLSNAIKFRKESVPAVVNITATVTTREELTTHGLPADRTFHKIVVQDNGIGFEETYTDRIFQIFQRLHGRAEYPGSGIGLAICKKIVDNHNGVIFARSKPEEGSVFTVILPEKQF